MVDNENLEEGWVKFIRLHCKEGYIDQWIGDCSDNPNNESKHPMQLNSFVTYYRLNDQKWLHSDEIGRHILSLLDIREEYTAQEIWDEAIRKKNK